MNSIFEYITTKKVVTNDIGDKDRKRSKSIYNIPNRPNNWFIQIKISNILVRFFNEIRDNFR